MIANTLTATDGKGFRINPLNFMTVLAVLLTLLGNFFEVHALFQGSLHSLAEPITPPSLKILKDVCMTSILFLGAVGIILRGKITNSVGYWTLLVTFGVSSIATLLRNGALPVLLGIRWFMPVLLFPVFISFVSDRLQRMIAWTLLVVFAIGLALQGGQYFLSTNFFGKNTYGYSLRNPGIYIVPSSMALLALSTMYYAWSYINIRSIRFVFVFIACPLSVFLTGSGTGWIALGMFYVVISAYNLRLSTSVMMSTVFATACFVLALVPSLTGRYDIFNSITELLSIFKGRLIIEDLLYSSNLASGTNVAKLLDAFEGKNVIKGAFISDSTITSVISGIGVSGACLMALMVASAMFLGDKKAVLFITLSVPFFVTVIILEVFPFNLLFFLNLAYFQRVRLDSQPQSSTTEPALS